MDAAPRDRDWLPEDIWQSIPGYMHASIEKAAARHRLGTVNAPSAKETQNRDTIARDIARVVGCQVHSDRTRRIVDYIVARGCVTTDGREAKLERLLRSVPLYRLDPEQRDEIRRALEVLSAKVGDWRPIETAPRDGSWFFTKDDCGGDYPYDVARYDADLDDFVKAGCGYQYVKYWRSSEG